MVRVVSAGVGGDALRAKGSPPRRRWTRSQSRELESRQKDAPGRSSLGKLKKAAQSKGSLSLDVVVEESPRKSTAQVIPESPEDAYNMSGTTILPSEPENDLYPEMMLDALPDLERAAKNTLEFLVLNSDDPVTIVNKAKRHADPTTTQSRRLARFKSKLLSEIKDFGGKTYIDVTRTSESILSLLQNKDGDIERWSPEPVLHQANCARLALEVLLINGNSSASKKAIKDAERLFPSAFMSDLTRHGQRYSVGKSSLEKDTFELALELRTHAIIIRLEDLQHGHGFDPHAILRDSFFLDVPADENFEASDAPLRGFGLDAFGGTDRYLPARFREAAYDRYNYLRVLLPEDEDGYFDIEELKSTYRWKSLVLRTASWLRKRCAEIDQDLDRQQNAEDIKRHDLIAEAQESSRVSLGSANASGLTPRRTETRGERGTVAPSDNRRDDGDLPETRTDTPSIIEPTARRKSGKPSFLNAKSIDRLVQRQQQSRVPADKSQPRRQSEIIERQTFQRENDDSESHRRRTLPASLQQPAPEPAPESPREIPVTREASPILSHDEQDMTFVSDELFVGERTQLEKSRSPVMTRFTRHPRREPQSPTPSGAARERRRQSSSNSRSSEGHQSNHEEDSTQANTTLDLAKSSEEILNAIQRGHASKSDKAPGKTARVAFIDRQEDASRVSPISQEQDPQSAERRRRYRQSKKRRRRNSEEQSSDEDPFQSDARPVDVARRRAAKPDQPLGKRQRRENAEDEPAAQLQDGLQEEARGGAVPEAEATRDTASVPVSSSATHNVTSTKSTVRWTPSEDRRLIRLIEEVGLGGKGSNWCKIERQNEAQAMRDGETRIEGRNQVQLKDRARNLKIGFLRDRKPLPRYFEYVTMKQKDYAMLERKGITVPPEQRGGLRK
ncbi:hypothetical protein BDV25DRAFT_154308 [Aspergillus avenaceus]|uniref:Myb-like domain-containing protein n=1 Tax=Aspergillus avenaceus TaxID=36643 RepID=A0A5N6TVS6_ASPAV|nr:hypothetical protein BDV25DRAFT_154308 [Aspergillus avenaceus]